LTGDFEIETGDVTKEIIDSVNLNIALTNADVVMVNAFRRHRGERRRRG